MDNVLKSQKILITGRPRVGKTTLIKHCAQILGDRAAGFYTEEIPGEGVRGRRGFRLITLDGREGILAEVDAKSHYHLGRYGIHLDVMEKLGVPTLMEALQNNNKEWILIDEIGKMEEESKSFKNAVMNILESSKNFLAAIRWHDSDFTKQIKNRNDVQIFKLTVPSREIIYQTIEKILI